MNLPYGNIKPKEKPHLIAKKKANLPHYTLLCKSEQKENLNPQYVTEYSTMIFEDLKKNETINVADYSSLFNCQEEITEAHRKALIEWLYAVYDKFNLLPETLYLTINIIDRYIEKKPIEVKKFQLVGVVAMFIASKYEEIYAPEIRDFVMITNNTLKREDILKMEYLIMRTLNFELYTISPFVFLNRFHFVSGDSKKSTLYLARYVLDICLLDVNFCKYKSSVKAASVLFLARKMLKIDESNTWNNELKMHSHLDLKDLKDCAKEALRYLNKNLNELNGTAMYKKYYSCDFNYISKIFDIATCNLNSNKKI